MNLTQTEETNSHQDFIHDIQDETEQPQLAPDLILPDKYERGDVMVRGFWDGRKDAILDVRITDLDAKSYRNRDSTKFIEDHEELKKKKYGEACKYQNRGFTAFVCSVDGFLGKESNSFLKSLAVKLVHMWRKNTHKYAIS